jgi:DNA-binding MarR family transcriptional regulator
MNKNGHGKRMRSVEASRAVWQSTADLTKSELLMLQALAHHADQNLECYPSMERLAVMTRLSKRQAIRVIDSLRKKGLISVSENAGGRHRCNRYRLLVSVNGDIGNSDTRNGDILKRQR